MVAVSSAITPRNFDRLGVDLAVVHDPASIEREWRDFARQAVGHVFAEYDFIALWLKTVAPECGIEPRIVVVRSSAGQPIAILPFGIRTRLGIRLLEWLGGEQADYPGGFWDQAFLSDLAQEERAASLREMVFELIDADLVRLVRQLPEFGGFPNPFLRRDAQRGPEDAHWTALGADWQDYYAGKRKGSWRKHDRQKLKTLEAIGDLRFVTSSEGADPDPILEALFAQKRRGLGELGVGDLFASPGVRAFYAGLAQRPYPAGPSHTAALEIGGQTIATNWGLVHGDRYYYVMHAFADGPAGRASPGQFLMYRLMQWSIDRGIGIFDFTVGDTAYKLKWCETTVPLYTVLTPRNAKGSGLAAALRGTIALKRLIKTNPALWEAARFTRRHIAGRRSRPASPGKDA